MNEERLISLIKRCGMRIYEACWTCEFANAGCKDALIIEAAEALENRGQGCKWRYLEDVDAWETDCGQMHIINDGTPAENGMIYCTYCGRKLRG